MPAIQLTADTTREKTIFQARMYVSERANNRGTIIVTIDARIIFQTVLHHLPTIILLDVRGAWKYVWLSRKKAGVEKVFIDIESQIAVIIVAANIKKAITQPNTYIIIAISGLTHPIKLYHKYPIQKVRANMSATVAQIAM